MGKLLLKLTFPMDKGLGKSPSNKIVNQDKQEVAPGEQNVRVSFEFLASYTTLEGKIF